jgi:hypothetical protein
MRGMKTTGALLMLAGIITPACGGGTTGGGAAGGPSDAGLLGATGGSGGAPITGGEAGGLARPASQGSASIHFQGPSTADAALGKMCPAGVHFADAPSAFTTSDRTTGSSRPPETIVDGEKSREFTCLVTPSGDKFAVSASINVPAFDKDGQPLNIPTQIKLETTIGKGEAGAPGTLSVSDDQTAGLFFSSMGCLFSVKPDTTRNKLAIDDGKAWGSVTCDSIANPSDPATSCMVDSGYFILENCLPP